MSTLTASADRFIVTECSAVEKAGFFRSFLADQAVLFVQEVVDVSSLLLPGFQLGIWHYYRVSNGCFYIAPPMHKSITMVHKTFHASVTSDAAGIIATLIALEKIEQETGDARCFELYHRLNKFSRQHSEALFILEAVF